MRIAFISDVHANLEALQATLADIQTQKVDAIHFLGDAVGYGCDPNACVELICRHCDVKLLGNHDFAALGLENTEFFNDLAKNSIDWSRKEMTEHTISALADFELEALRPEFHLVHASPRTPELWEYILTSQDARDQFECFERQVLFVGHSHIPEIFTRTVDGSVLQRVCNEQELDEGNRYIVNIGSVGQPRDRDPRACYVTFDIKQNVIRYHRVEYDILKTVTRMEQLGLPAVLSERLRVGK